VDLALHRRPSGCHLSQRGSDHLSPTSQDGLSDRVANCCNSTDGAHNLRQTGYFDLQHSIAIFAFFFRYFSSTRPNEFFQIQAYLIHWFRLLALLFSLLTAGRRFPLHRRCGEQHWLQFHGKPPPLNPRACVRAFPHINNLPETARQP
jgi:hypothetical protein